ncbi:MAG TPA: hypothetical protein VEV81_14055 [Pyrinomonadaceae bacterium]|jgi:hypothetical protein|nr:hypothetical protein [Pyrinomonadaceae bacterium]
MIPVLLITVILLAGCVGNSPTTVTNANAVSNSSNMPTMNSANSGATAGTGPQNQGIGGNTNAGAVNNNTYTVPPGFNKNGDRGSASSTSNTP